MTADPSAQTVDQGRPTPLERPVVRCANCASAVAGRYCSACGEPPLGPEIYSFRTLAKEAVNDIFNLEGKVLFLFKQVFRALVFLVTLYAA